MVLRGVSAVCVPLWWPCLGRGLCPCMLGITWWHREALSHLCQAEGPCLSCLCPFPLSWLLQRAPGQSRPPSVTVCVPPVGVPVLSLVCRRCYHKTKSSLWRVKWPNPECCKIN
ncbi:hypothetical protein Nmel_017268 [Mimus melanotis]